MAFTAKDVQSLRATTNCGMMDCKKALTEADGDMDKAIELLREKGLAAAVKKASRVAADGIVCAKYNADARIGVVIEINSETDFVAKNADFVAFAELCADVVIAQNPADVDALLALKHEGATIEEMLREKILVIGENLKIRRFARAEGAIATYVHGGGKIGVMVKFSGDPAVAANEAFTACGKDVAMQIAAINPAYLISSEVPADVVEKEKEILVSQIQNDEKLKNKPAQVIEKMVEGRVNKYYKENCLLEQGFVKDDKITVAQYVANVAKEIGADIAIESFVRFEKGEGIEKKEDNFADEVAKMAQQ